MKTTPRGFVLIMSTLVMTSLLVVGAYLLSTADSENKIANVQSLATKNYYLAETGINDMLWKIQNDTATKNAFLNGTLSATNDISKSSVFGDTNASYQVTARNTVTAEAWIIATSTYQIGDNVSQRVVKSYISRPTGSGTTWEYATFAGGRGSQQNGNFRFTGSGIVLRSTGGRLHANQEFKVQGAEIVVTDGAVTSSNVINVVAGGKITLNNSYKEAPTSTVDMLQIDIDSDDPNSWKSRATATYTKTQFKNLPNNTTLNGIIYVAGEAEIIGKNMTINGVLVAEGEIEVTLAGRTLTVNSDATYGGGLISKEDVDITTSGGTVNINGLIYAGDDLEITSSGTVFNINGSMTGFDAEITSSGGAINLVYTPENFQKVIDPIYNPNGPLIQIDHWEEQY
ncbi:MAG: hypothetical protein HUU49_00920 [Candidatus Buchananbacteria bacterium]|nr:hypothetical protein [Candidatus Buchananbacteria bacterium]